MKTRYGFNKKAKYHNITFALTSQESFYYTFARDEEFFTKPLKYLCEKHHCSNNVIIKWRKLLKSDKETIFNALYRRELSTNYKNRGRKQAH